MPRHELIVSRRTAIRLGVLTAWSLSALTIAPTPAGTAVPIHGLANEGDEEETPRYRFDSVTPLPDFAPLGRLEEVWASPGYMKITDCIVSYIGAEPFLLTAQESAIVDVAEAAGAVVDDRPGLYLVVLAASTRIDPARFDAKLAELGRPVASAALALAPEAPQAARFAAWLEATG